MAVGFPPQPAFPIGLDSDRTLFLVYNTSESKTTADNSPWEEVVEIVPVRPGQPEIWADNGFANISGELFYYDSVDKDSNGKVFRLKRCARNIGGKETRFNPKGTWVRGFVIAEHHNQIVDAVIATQRYILELDDNLDLLSEQPVCVDDAPCVDVQLDTEVIEDQSTSPNCSGTTISYNIAINGTFDSFVLDFGDGQSTSTSLSGSHTYSPGAAIDPVVTVVSELCTVVQTPVTRDVSDPPPPNTPPPPVVLVIPEPCDFPDITIPEMNPPPPQIELPPIVFPCLDVAPSVNIPSIISIVPPEISIIPPTFNPIPSVITFGPAPFIGPTSFTFGPAPTVPPTSFTFGPAPTVPPTSFTFGPAPTVPPTSFTFGPAPTVPPTSFTFGPAPTIQPVQFTFGPAPTIQPVQFTFGPAPTVKPASFTFGPAPTVKSASFIFGPAPTVKSASFTFGPAPTVKSASFTFGPAPTISNNSFTFGPAPNISASFNWGTPPFVSGYFSWGETPSVTGSFSWGTPPVMSASFNWGSPPVVSSSFEWGDVPSVVGSFVWGEPPSVTASVDWGVVPKIVTTVEWPSTSLPLSIEWGAVPKIQASVEWGAAPSVNVNWGPVPTISCVVAVECPGGGSQAGLRRSMTLDDNFVDDFNTDDFDIEIGDLGIPSEIKVVAPKFPDIKVQHDIPSFIDIKSDIPSRITVYQSDVMPKEIRVVAESVPEAIFVDASSVPKSIAIDAGSIPGFISLVAPDLPSVIRVDGSGIPESIRVEGIPDSIEVRMPSEIVARLEVPENLEIPLVYRGGPVPIQFDASVLSGGEEQVCFALVPCGKK